MKVWVYRPDAQAVSRFQVQYAAELPSITWFQEESALTGYPTPRPVCWMSQRVPCDHGVPDAFSGLPCLLGSRTPGKCRLFCVPSTGAKG